MEGLFTVKPNQIRTYRLALKVLDKQLSIKDFSEQVGLSYRQSQRIIKVVAEKDLLGILHGNINKVPVNKIPKNLEQTIVNLLEEKYRGFNLIHFKEMLEANEGIKIGKDTIYRIAKNNNLQPTKYRRSNKIHKPRPRLAQEGMLIQFDGSPHRWFGGIVTDLIAAIDDATGKILSAEFFFGETSLNSMKVIRDLIYEHGVPFAFYTDQAGIYGKKDREHSSQISRALASINCKLIVASTPQAKGRVERLFKTLQSRLTSELKLFNVTTIEDANKFLKQDFIPRFNEQFSVAAREPEKAFTSNELINLENVFCRKMERKIGQSNTFSYESKIWVVDDKTRYDRKMVNINTHLDGSISFDIMGKKVKAYKTEDECRFLKKAA
jgi:transposase